MNNLDDYKVYVCKDNRVRAYNKETKAIVSYPKLLMENILGRPLKPNEDVHHKDGNPLNNNPWNLTVIDHAEHGREHAKIKGNKIKPKKETNFEHHGRKKLYSDEERVCPICSKTFIWTGYQQRRFYQNPVQRDVFCSRECLAVSKQKVNITIDEIIEVLKKNNGNFTTSAKEIGMTDNGLRKRLKAKGYSVSSEDYKF